MRRRPILWILALAVIFGFGWYKSSENRVRRESHAAWDEQMRQLEAESRKEFPRLVTWLRKLHSEPGGRQQIVEELSGGHTLSFQEVDGREVTSWVHPEYGIRVTLKFDGDRLVGHQASGGSPRSIHPMPDAIATSSGAERAREVIARWGAWVWLVCLVLALMLRGRYGIVAAEMMLAAALASGVAWTVSPHYSITVHGVFSNDRLFFAAIMLMTSLVMLAVRIAPFVPRRGIGFIRYRIRTLLAVMGIVAILSAMGPLGLLAACVLLIGGAMFIIVLRILIVSPNGPPLERGDGADV